MDPIPTLTLPADAGLDPGFCGIFISSGVGRHVARTLDTWELIIVERGRLGIAVGSQEHDLGPGEWLLIPAGTPHGGTVDFPRDLRFAWLHFRPKEGPGIALPPRGTVPDPAAMAALVRRLLHAGSGPQADPLVSALHLALILVELARAPAAMGSTSLLATRALRSIRVRYRDPDFGTDQLAAALGVTPDHLSRCFRQAHGQTVMEAINTCRLTEAKRLLVIGGMSIAQVATAAGFASAPWMRRLMVRLDGIGPREWRRIHARAFVNSV